MVSTNDIRPGQSILVDNTLYLILEYQHVKPGKGKAFVKTKLKNLSSGGVLDKTFRADEDVQQAFIDKQMFHFLYKDGEDFIFMNNDTYEHLSVSPSVVEDKYLFLTSNQEVTIQMYNDTPIDLVLPPTVTLKVSKAEPAVKGDTVSSSTKSITCETGLVLNVPMFIEQDEMIKVDTKNSSYMTRI